MPGYDGTIYWGALLLLLGRLALALYMVSSALARFDFGALRFTEVLLRLLLAGLIISGDPVVYTPAIIAALVWLGFHFWQRRAADQPA